MNHISPQFENRIPNFFLLGAPKAGTTSVFAYLCQHPDIYPALVKETHFFRADELFSQGHDFYLEKYFEGAETYKIRGEGTPAYLPLVDLVAPRLKDFLGNRPVKFIAILRNPVDRAWSNYLHRTRSGIESLSFEEALADEPRRKAEGETSFSQYFGQGLYGEHLQKWFEYFPKESFGIFQYEELKDMDGFLKKVFAFLEIDENVEIDTSKRKNQASVSRSKWLSKAIYDSPKVKGKLFRALVPLHLQKGLRTRIRQMILRPLKKNEIPKINPSTEKQLLDQYEPDIQLLENLLDKDLSAWRKVKEKA